MFKVHKSHTDIGLTHARQVVGSGEMADLIRNFDWASTSVGPIAQWTESLLLYVNMMLGTRYPVLILWGPEMLLLYNDGFRPIIMDRHPQALGMSGREFWTDVWPVVGEQLESVLREGRNIVNERALVPILRESVLSEAYFNYSYSPLFHADGTIAGIITICEDVTNNVIADRERLIAENALRQRQEELDRTLVALHAERNRILSIIQQAPVFFAVLEGPEHRITMVNDLYLKLVGRRDVMGKAVADILPEAIEQGYVALLDRVRSTGESVSMQGARFDFTWAEGLQPDERYLDFVYQPLREQDNTVSGIIVIGVDVTEGKRAGKALMQSEKLAAVGRLAASIAHEINNPLAAVTNLLYLARGAKSLPEVQGFLNIADRELRRVAIITSQTLRFNKQSSAPRAVTGHDLFSSVLDIYQGRLVNADISVETRFRAHAPVICFDGEIRQVLNNLVSNSIDAMPGSGGRILLRAHEGTDWSSGRKGLNILVADTGTGISPEIAKRIFEPFFTTKDLGGTGLGLWLSRDIIRRHRGSLRGRSSQRAASHGTVFKVFLPFEAASSTHSAGS